MIDKSLVKERFKKSLNTYTKNSIIQNKMADNLIKMVSQVKQFSSILELGCGSGVLTKKIVENFDFKNYDAVDIVDDCSKFINQISPDICFTQSDIENFKTDTKYNLIISNATIQWVEKLPDFLKKMYENLEDNGLFLFTTFGKDNFNEIKKITGQGLEYYSTEEIKKILQDYAPFSLKIETEKMEFETPKDVLKHLKLTGVNSITSKHWTKTDLAKFESEYRKLCPDKITLTYNPVYVAVFKQ